MLTEFFWSKLRAIMWLLADSLNGLVPGPPAWVEQFASGWSTVWAYVYQFDTWLPITFGIVCFTSVVVTYFAGLVIGAIRVVLSYVTFGGNT